MTREDVLFAGAVTSRLAELNPSTSLNDEANMARDTWRTLESSDGDTAVNLQTELAATLGGRNLIKLGYQSDFLPVSEIDSVDIVPAWNPTTGVIQVP